MKKTKLLLLLVLCLVGSISTWGAGTIVTTPTEGKYYTLECRSSSAHKTARFIGLSGDALHGQCSAPAFFQFEVTSGGYYIKENSTGKYFNWADDKATLSEDAVTVWEFRDAFIANTVGLAPTGTATGQALNNNGGTNCLKMGGFTGSGNACSHWEMVEYENVITPTDWSTFTAISDYAGLANDKAYALITKRGGLVWDGTNTNLSVASAETIDPENANHQFALLKSKTENKAYLFNLGAQKFVKRNGSATNCTELTEDPTEAWTVKGSDNSDYPIMLDSEDGHHFNISGGTIKVDSWSYADDGNRFAVYITPNATESVITAAYNKVVAHESKYTVSSNISDGGVIYNSTNYVAGSDINAATITIEELSAISVTGYKAEITILGYTINVNYTHDLTQFTQIMVIDDLSNSKAYYVQAHDQSRGAWTYNSNDAGHINSTVKAGVTADIHNTNQQFAFIKSETGRYYLYSIAAGKFANYDSNGKFAALTDDPSDNVIFRASDASYSESPYVVSFADGTNFHDIAISNNYSHGIITSWNSTADGGNCVKIYDTEVAFDATAALAQIANYEQQYYVNTLTELIGTTYDTSSTDPGYYNATQVTDAKNAAQSALDNPSRTIISLSNAITAYNNAIAAAMIMPEAGKTYQIISAVPGFETQQGVKKAMRINDDKTQLTWGTVDNDNKKFYWKVEEVSGANITFKSVSGGLYPQPQTQQSSVVSVGTTKNACTIASLGSQQFTITPVDGTYNLHTGGHGNGAGVSGNIVSWNAGLNTGSAWYIHEATAPETYSITFYIEQESERVWEKTYDVVQGGDYPTDVTINPFINVTLPSGTPTDDEEVKLEYTTNYYCYDDVASVDTWYALDVHTNYGPYTVYNNTEDATNVGIYTSTPDYQHGAVIDNNFAWAFIGNPFTGIKLYNKTTGQYITAATDGATATWSDGSANATFQVLPTNGNIANSFALKIDGYTNYLNHQGTALKGWSANDEGSSFRAFPINDAAYSLEYTFGAQYGTIIIPAYSAIPTDVKAFTCSAADGSTLTLTEETSMIKANVPYILEGTGSVTFSNSFSTGTYTEASTSGLLTGVFTATEVPTNSYVLLNKVQGLGFYHVSEGNEPTVGANRCYLTMPGSETKAFFLDNATAIEALETLTSGKAKIYDIQGRELKSLQKGINIVNGQKVLVK